ncbi:MAG: AzlD domain-containing protein [Proteobacteria bacterium]|nr:AzlD domain-containing protein [Pseudomonadota bacterium]
MNNETLWLIVLGSSAATFFWRLLGVTVVEKIDPEGAVFEWVSCVSYAMVAGLVFRMIMMPESDLASVSLAIRCAAVTIAFTAYFAFRRMLLAGVLAGGASLSIMASWAG